MALQCFVSVSYENAVRFESPITLRFLTIVYDVQNVSATAARQHYFGLNLRNLIPESESVITLEAVFSFL